MHRACVPILPCAGKRREAGSDGLVVREVLPQAGIECEESPRHVRKRVTDADDVVALKLCKGAHGHLGCDLLMRLGR